MTAAAAAAELTRLGVAVTAKGGRFRLAAGPKRVPDVLVAAVRLHKGDVLRLLGIPCVLCPVCHDHVCPDRTGGWPGRVADCGPERRPLKWAMVDAAGLYSSGENPGCPFGGG